NGENETLASGDVVTLNAKLRGTFERGFTHGGLIIVEWNETALDNVIVDFGGKEVPVPTVYSTSAVYSGISQSKAYTFPAVLGNQIMDGKITIDADDTQNPGFSNDPNMTIYTYNYFVNDEKGGAYEIGAEDEDDVLAYGHTGLVTLQLD
ncbi:MAG: hypothetical protein AABY22_15475, partial [Nanoarchaeota archaeon]